MRTLKMMLMTLILGGLVVSSVSCAAEADSAALSENEVITVQRGNLAIDITAVGNLALSLTDDLAFDIFYNEATVAEVLVEEGDTVATGQLLATLDVSEWQDELGALEDKVTTAQRQLTATERQLATKQRELIQADINLINAQITLEQTDTTYTIYDLKAAQADLDEARRNLEEVVWKLSRYEPGSFGYEAYQKLLVQAQASLNTVENRLNSMLSGFDTEEVVVKKLQVTLNEIRLEEAQNAIKDAQTAIGDAQKELWDAQKELDKANGQSPEIRATFDGFITLVNVEGGDEVMTGTVAVQLADPDKFEAEVMVSEMDILQIKLGGDARVQVDAVIGLNLPAKVTHISPTAIIQSGIVNYTVKVEIQSLEAAVPERPEGRHEARPDVASGELPERLKQAVEEGRFTQEQAEEMMGQRQQGQGGPSGGHPGQVTVMPPEGFQLREGLTVTVSILVVERNDVLLVPSKMITSQGGETYVRVSKDGIIEERLIKTGVSDYQNTEVVDGLSEGEKVVIPGANTDTPAAQQGQRSSGFRVPFLGRGGGQH